MENWYFIFFVGMFVDVYSLSLVFKMTNTQTITFSQALNEFLNSRDMLIQAARMHGQGSVVYKQWAVDYDEKVSALDNFLMTKYSPQTTAQETQRIRELACLCAAQAICCRQEGEAPVPLLWSMAVFFESYIHDGSEGTREDFGPKEPTELKVVQ